MKLPCPDVLGGVVGYAVSNGGEAGQHQGIELHGGRVACHDRRAEAVDNTLNDDVAHRNEALLQNAGDGDHHNFPQKHGGKHRGLFSRADLLQPADHHEDGQHAANALAQEGSPGHTGHTHLKSADEEDIHRNIGDGGYRQKIKGRLGVPHGGKNTCSNVVEEDKGQSVNVNIQIQPGIPQDLLGCADQPQQPPGRGDAQHHQPAADQSAENTGGIYGGLHAFVVLGPIELAHHHRAAHIAAKGKRNENQGNLIAVANGSQGILADEFPRHQAVGNVIELLKNNAAQQRYTEIPQNHAGFSHCQILIHKRLPSFFTNLSSIF